MTSRTELKRAAPDVDLERLRMFAEHYMNEAVAPGITPEGWEEMSSGVLALLVELAERWEQVDKYQQWIDEINVALGGLGINLQEDRLKAIDEARAQLAEAQSVQEQDLQAIVDAYQEGFSAASLTYWGSEPADVTEWQESFAQSGASNYVAARNSVRRAKAVGEKG